MKIGLKMLIDIKTLIPNEYNILRQFYQNIYNLIIFKFKFC
jgi:hypothetical protein